MVGIGADGYLKSIPSRVLRLVIAVYAACLPVETKVTSYNSKAGEMLDAVGEGPGSGSVEMELKLS